MKNQELIIKLEVMRNQFKIKSPKENLKKEI